VEGVTFAGSAITVLAVLTFAGIVVWAYSSGRKKRFDQAAQAPFALSDDAEGIGSGNSINQDIDQRGRQP
jgi:cbb3-type cytochrome oxidase subunit 3